MAPVPLLVALAPPLLLGAVCIALLGISRSGKKRPGLQRFEHTQAFSNDSSRAKRQAEQETSGTLARSRSSSSSSGSMATTRRARPATSAEAILQFVLDALHHLTGLPLLMVNQPDHNLPCLTRASAIETQMRADQKNAELLSSLGSRNKGDFPERSASSTWSDYDAPEEEMSDLSSDEEDTAKQGSAMENAPVNTAQGQLFDGMEFYLAVSQVRERTVRSVLALGIAKTLTTLRDRKQNESIAVIEQRYPDFTCLPTTSRSTAVQQLPGAPLDLLAALRLPSAAAVAQSQSPMKGPVRARLAADDEGRVRRPSLPSHGPNISRVA
ncbi:hypothetical protein PHYPSEUDO_009378 [Phytophthora pseudosyringae]|uniref:RxLR effector candidate protein n=1 Tax=Phytophthora pseudosyringae TaxID=221518 RepID=A0A8T1WC96_9STRA|nr:hypothetical protein PHYPSEUDO_009378 [Phytophthora pseudosyringae]